MREIFEKKYGKDFVSAAVDLRPDAVVNNLVSDRYFFYSKKSFCCGYCLLHVLLNSELDSFLKLIEKLSVKKPSGQTKLKILKEIAKEHQID
jgi:hypothetical protein